MVFHFSKRILGKCGIMSNWSFDTDGYGCVYVNNFLSSLGIFSIKGSLLVDIFGPVPKDVCLNPDVVPGGYFVCTR